MSTACKTTNTPNVVVCSEEKGVELMGMDLPQTDPYMVESEMEDDGLFGDAATANNRQAVSAPDGGDASDTADSPDAETAEARFLPGPQDPTQSQAEDHRASGHIPFRSWCSECVRARGTGEKHRKRKDRRDICVFSFDYLHLDEAGNLATTCGPEQR